jgi:hypothetical protein
MRRVVLPFHIAFCPKSIADAREGATVNLASLVRLEEGRARPGTAFRLAVTGPVRA